MPLKTPIIDNTIKVLLIEDDEDDYVLTAACSPKWVGTEYSITWVSKIF